MLEEICDPLRIGNSGNFPGNLRREKFTLPRPVRNLLLSQGVSEKNLRYACLFSSEADVWRSADQRGTARGKQYAALSSGELIIIIIIIIVVLGQDQALKVLQLVTDRSGSCPSGRR